MSPARIESQLNGKGSYATRNQHLLSKKKVKTCIAVAAAGTRICPLGANSFVGHKHLLLLRESWYFHLNKPSKEGTQLWSFRSTEKVLFPLGGGTKDYSHLTT